MLQSTNIRIDALRKTLSPEECSLLFGPRVALRQHAASELDPILNTAVSILKKADALGYKTAVFCPLRKFSHFEKMLRGTSIQLVFKAHCSADIALSYGEATPIGATKAIRLV